MNHIILLCLLSLPALALERIALGSCHNVNRPQDHWELIAEQSPDVWLWLGDNIYADFFSLKQRRAAYNRLLEGEYGRYIVRDSQIKVLGIWDDHDYAYDGAEGNYSGKAESKQLLMEFLGYGADHPVFQREGIYHSYRYQEEGRSVLFLNLDVRYFMNKDRKQLLGLRQWAWLKSQLTNSDADVIFISGGINFLNPFRFWPAPILEGWFAFEKEQNRLFSLISKVAAPVVLLSGDRHSSDVAKKILPNGKEVYELMASGITHNAMGVPNKYRISKAVKKKNFGLIDLYWKGDRLEGLSLQIISAETGKVLVTELTHR